MLFEKRSRDEAGNPLALSLLFLFLNILAYEFDDVSRIIHRL